MTTSCSNARCHRKTDSGLYIDQGGSDPLPAAKVGSKSLAYLILPGSDFRGDWTRCDTGRAHISMPTGSIPDADISAFRTSNGGPLYWEINIFCYKFKRLFNSLCRDGADAQYYYVILKMLPVTELMNIPDATFVNTVKNRVLRNTPGALRLPSY